MSEFDINTDVINGAAEGFGGDYRDLNNLNFQILCVRCRLFGASMIPIRLHLARLETQLLVRSRRVYKMSNKLGEISRRYTNADGNAAQHTATTSSPAFDEDGQYGGNQGSPRANWRDMADIVRKYHPDWSDKKIRDYLDTLNSEGCGYVAMINTIFLYYNGREAEFEKTFGFPMYKDGELNYDAMVTDFYCAEDDPNHSGTNVGSREKMGEHYCKEHGIKADVHNVDVTAENFNEVSKNGQVVVGLSPVILYDEAGNQLYNIQDAGHAMTVTGVTDDGRLIVSSWGKTYYLDKDLSVYNDHIDFQQVRYGV